MLERGTVTLLVLLAVAPSADRLVAAFRKSFEELSVHTLPDSGSLDDCPLRLQKRASDEPVSAPTEEYPSFSRQFAHLAALGWKSAGGSAADIEWRCSGTLIAEDFVLTAAHCTQDEGAEPTVVRLGDLDLYDAKDDRYVQQIAIAEIIRHPEFNFNSAYHDVALLRLQQSVTVNDFVTPACLYTNDSLPFNTLHTTGWDFYAEVSPPIVSSPLRVIAQDRCKFWYRDNKEAFRKGINRMLMCAGDEQLKSCPSDTGGPLQVQLLSSSRYTPFVVGVSALGVPCGATTPGVYAKVPHYILWIESVTKRAFHPPDCVVRHISKRERDTSLVAPELKTPVQETHQTGKRSTVAANPLRAKLHVFKEFKCAVGVEGENVEWLCGCTIVAQDFALTSARCVKDVDVDVVNYRNDWKKVAEVIFHPEYDRKTLYNDLALIRLQTDNRNRYDWKAVSCVAAPARDDDQREYLSFGIGPHNLADDGLTDGSTDTAERYLTATLQLLENGNCTAAYEGYGILKAGLNETQFCLGAGTDHLVPGACEPWNGNEVLNEIRPLADSNPFPEDLVGVSSYAPECGFGRRPLVASRAAAFLGWMNSVVYKATDIHRVPQVLVEKELALDYICEASDREAGVCVHIDHCSHRALAKDVVKVCTNETATIVCCPVNSFIATAHLPLLTECEANYQRFRKKYVEFATAPDGTAAAGRPLADGDHAHSALIGWKVNRTATAWHCMGTLINLNTVLTTAGCANSVRRRSPDVISVGETDVARIYDGAAQLVRVKETIRYPSYNPKTHEYDIAVLKLESDVLPSANAIPACLWRDLNRTPYYGQAVHFDGQSLSVRDKNLVHNRDCKLFTSHTELNNDQLCWQAFRLRPDGADGPNCGRKGDPLITLQRSNNIYLPYLVGLYSHDQQCAGGEPIAATRISSYINWISLYM
ncbi:transmembrane protease serine 9-like [Anopheles bellator]|uniref:transmembrane protease serine 9-like n=1 Tax=Anopheles bellator TaxID=139047 RepID=UPI002648A5E9|nr:transmembrane protease serine 9-like [Anopheles bellator]